MQLKNIWNNLPPVTKNLLIINVIVWGALNLFSHVTTERLLNVGALHYFTSDHFLPSQLFTYMFMHESFMHLFFNMFALFMFGGIIEQVMGSKRFLFYYISCGIGAALIQEGVFAIMISHLSDSMDPRLLGEIKMNGAAALEKGLNFSNMAAAKLNILINIPTLGASGAIYGVLLAFGFIFPKRPIYLMFIPIPIQARWMVIGYGAIELLQAMSNNPGDNVAHLAHLGGMIFGLLMLLWWRKKKVINVYNF
ncbi:MAG: rhomboid family intramembrane serine protease [Bacteroidales bacterium]|nr:rhomboid family intramembrane serine protease [Bacteroidales bacterium]